MQIAYAPTTHLWTVAIVTSARLFQFALHLLLAALQMNAAQGADGGLQDFGS